MALAERAAATDQSLESLAQETQRLAQAAIERGCAFKLRPSMIMKLHRAALQGVGDSAGRYRSRQVSICNSKHIPPEAHLVPELVEDLCDYINSSWADATAIHLAAYVMWRIGAVHPFGDANGRISRAAAALVLMVKRPSPEMVIGSTDGPAIPLQISDDQQPGYYAALAAADAAALEGKVDVSRMETWLEKALRPSPEMVIG